MPIAEQVSNGRANTKVVNIWTIPAGGKTKDSVPVGIQLQA